MTTLAKLLQLLTVLGLFCAPLAARAADEANASSKAKEHYLSGQTHYALGEFGEAVTEFREAYRLKNEPAILFNIAQAMRQLGNFKQAYFYYSQYLSRKPAAANRSEVESFMEAMHKKLEADEEADKARAHAEAARPPAPRSPEDHLEEAEGPAPATGKAAGQPPATAPQGKGATPTVSAKAAAVAKAAPGPASKTTTITAVAVEARPAPQASGKPSDTAAPGAAAPDEALQANAASPRAAAAGWATPLHIAGVAALGAGAVAGALALVFHGGARADANTLDQKYANHTLAPGDTALKDSVKSKGALATVSAIGCAALLVAGATLTFVF